MMKLAAIILACSYLLGSVPFGLLAGFAFKRIDIRQYGSGNIGASNVLRLLGWPAALLVFLLDTAKGFVPVWVAQGYDLDPLIVAGTALASILGHNCSLFLGFRGGKGAATSLGVVIGIAPHIAAIAFFVWVLVVSITRYISVGSILAGISVPLLMWASSCAQAGYLNKPYPPEYLYLALFGAGFILLKHRSNLVRLVNGVEGRIGQRIDIGPGRGGGPAEPEGGEGNGAL